MKMVESYIARGKPRGRRLGDVGARKGAPRPPAGAGY